MSILQDKSIVLGVTGGIAAYKVVEVASRLVKSGAMVDVIMTEAATDAEPLADLERRLYADEAAAIRKELSLEWTTGMRAFLETLSHRTSILSPHDGPDADWRFWHRSFREALTAQALEAKLRERGRRESPRGSEAEREAAGVVECVEHAGQEHQPAAHLHQPVEARHVLGEGQGVDRLGDGKQTAGGVGQGQQVGKHRHALHGAHLSSVGPRG